MIAEVQPGSPAEASGFKPGDELVRVGALPVANVLDLERGLLDVRPGQPAIVKIRRGSTETALPWTSSRSAPRSPPPTPMTWSGD